MPVIGPILGAKLGTAHVRRIYQGLNLVEKGRCNFHQNGSMEGQSALVVVKTNYFIDPRFTNVALWSATAGTRVIDTDGRLKVTSSGTSAIRLGVTHNINALAAGTYTISVDLEATSALLTGARIYMYDTTTSAIMATGLFTAFAPNTGNKRYSVTVTSTGSANRMYIEFTGTAIGTGDNGWMDNAQLEAGAQATPFFCGSSPQQGPMVMNWASTVDGSASQAKMPITSVLRTNLALNPVALNVGIGWSPNNSAINTVTKGVAITGHPEGITTAAKGTMTPGHAAGGTIFSTYNIDGLSNTGVSRYHGAWVWTPYSGYVVYWFQDGLAQAVLLPVNTWLFVPSKTKLAANTYSGLYIQKQTGLVTNDAEYVYVTGVTTDATYPVTYSIWGDKPPTADVIFRYTGAPGTSSSTETGSTIPGTQIAAVGTFVTPASDQKHSGLRSVRVVTAGAVAGEGAAILSGGADTHPNTPVTGAVWVKGEAGVPLFLLTRLTGATQPDARLDFVCTGAWQFVQVSHTADAAGNALQIMVRTKNAQATQFWVDDAISDDVISIPDFKDGSYPGWAWDTVANASISRGIH